MISAAVVRFKKTLEHEWALSALLVLCVVLGALLWYLTASPLRGTVAATLIDPDGRVHAALVYPRDITLAFPESPFGTKAALLAAVPSPKGTAVAYLSRAKGGVSEVSVRSSESARLAVLRSGTVGTPQWSLEGTSIALAERRDTHDLSPESWVVVRATPRGDALQVGYGYRPFPSPNQRTFALTSRGIALLSYSDTEPNIVVASPVPVPISTPFTVSQDGMRVAWVAPADHSLQVFENVNGYFVPLLVKKEYAPQTLVFSPSGTHLLTGRVEQGTSTIALVTVSSGRVKDIGTVAGYIELHTWSYEK